MNNPAYQIKLIENRGILRINEPVSFGIPFRRGVLRPEKDVILQGMGTDNPPAYGRPLCLWPDGSVKWLLMDSQLSLNGFESKTFDLIFLQSKGDIRKFPPLSLKKILKPDGTVQYNIDTGSLIFSMNSSDGLPFSHIFRGNQSVLGETGGRLSIIDAHGKELKTCIKGITLETQNPLRIVLKVEGFFQSMDRVSPNFILRIHFFAGRNFSRIDLTLWNPRAAKHPNGMWDMGDPGSFFFKGLYCEIPIRKSDDISYNLKPEFEKPDVVKANKRLLLYQDSSGGTNWHSRNHMNYKGEIPLQFRGYRIFKDNDIICEDLRATPWMNMDNGLDRITVALPRCWQNFPKGLEGDAGTIKVHLFPTDYGDLYELQGGEQKTHSFFIAVGDHSHEMEENLSWIHEPIVPYVSPLVYYESGACPKPVPMGLLPREGLIGQYQSFIDVAVSGSNSFSARREQIDEFGWRNFGDLFADHEAVYHKSSDVFISHYNNQYYIIKGSLIQLMRTGDYEWFSLAHELALHVRDIDIYHTEQDRYEYNNGLFWHTDHHLDAATCTHRSFSRDHLKNKPGGMAAGGGPSSAHVYTSGLLYHYWMTGDTLSREAALTLSNFALRQVEGPDTLAQMLCGLSKIIMKWARVKLRKKAVGFQEIYDLDGPGRGSGNALNALIDGYLLTREKKYLKMAEDLIQRCVAPDDDIDARDLRNPEYRWAYSIFLQSLGKYLDIKLEEEIYDDLFWYARGVLLHYALWMVKNEYPYLDKPELLDIPNETWSAQELRKADVLAFAAKYAPKNLTDIFKERADFFFRTCIDQLAGYPERELTRPIVILMTNGMTYMDMYVGGGKADLFLGEKPLGYGITKRHSFNKGFSLLMGMFYIIKKLSIAKEVKWIIARINER